MEQSNDQSLRLAVLIDADNASRTAMRDVMAEIAVYGTPTIKRIYGDWTTPNMASWKPILLENAITPIQQYSYTTGKNSTDSAMIIDAMDILYTGQCDGFVLVSSDSDFTRLATRLREAFKLWMERYQVPAYDERVHGGLIRHFYVRVNQRGQSLCAVIANGTDLPHQEELVQALRRAEPDLAGVVLSVNQEKTNVILGKTHRCLWGRDYLEDTLCGLTFRLSVPSFYQVNREQAEVLYGRALAFAGLTGRETVLDLYCGIGTITLVMARQAGRAIGAEVIPAAVEDAKANAARNGVTNAEFLCADAAQAAQTLADRGLRPDVICVDPPRKGLAPAVIDAIVQMAPQRLVYVSCDPATLARDVKRMEEQGYVLQRAEAVDLFPRTAHVETVCLLSKLKY